MVDTPPSSDEVRHRALELVSKMRRVWALVGASVDEAAHLPAGGEGVDATQELLRLLHESMPLAMGDLLWLLHSFQARNPHLAPVITKVA